MWLPLIALAAGALVGFAGGGRPGRLAQIQLRAPWLLVAGAAAELVASLWGAGWPSLALLIAGYGLLVGFAAANLARTGMVLVAVGLLANLAVIAVDGGMPVRGLPPGVAQGARHHGIRPSDHLTALADDVRVAGLGETVSAGDLVLSVGVATTVAAALLGPRRRRVRPAVS
jgi:hypothetical protein